MRDSTAAFAAMAAATATSESRRTLLLVGVLLAGGLAQALLGPGRQGGKPLLQHPPQHQGDAFLAAFLSTCLEAILVGLFENIWRPRISPNLASYP